ncbi:MAG: ACP S-malonyltransferase [Candidatus Omnitrophota bacterium]|nr:MAG: ACP S-malonyltransferase [Candidatus Omnitrophota bacterium]
MEIKEPAKVAYMFPGQGAQYVGMAKSLYDNHEIARQTINRADEVLGFSLSKLMFEGPEKELTQTRNCQVAIMVASTAALKVHLTQKSEFTPEFALGLSLGEYTALIAANSMLFQDAVKLTRKRGEYMEEASEKNPGGMVSIIGLGYDTVREIANESGAEVANLNSPGQIVLSGTAESIKKAADIASKKGAKRAIFLKVSGAFHSSLMAEAGHRLAKDLENVAVVAPKIPIVSNVTANSTSNPEDIKQNLIDQVSTTTHWEESILRISRNGVKTFLEIGPGNVLKGLLKRIDPNLTCHSIPA